MSRALVPVHLLTGFLGAGKTTLLHRLLAEQPAEERLAVLVNEFGRVGIDGELLAGFSSQVRELRSGCICCELKNDFVAGLREILEQYQPGRVVVEATGLADAADLVGAVEAAAESGGLELASVVCVVDAEMFSEREMFGASYFSQIAAADLVLLNKIDLIEEPEIADMSQALAELNPAARLVPSVRCAVDRATIIGPRGPGGPVREAPLAGFQNGLTTLGDLTSRPCHTPGHADGFAAFDFEDSGLMDQGRLDQVLASLPWQVMRIKGYVRLEAGSRLLNYTYRRPEFTDLAEDRPTRLALVGWQVDPEEVLAKLRGCVLQG